MAAFVGFAFLVTVVTPVGKQVFLFVVTTIPNAMRCMATTAAMVKKAAVGRSKSPPLAVKKHLLVWFVEESMAEEVLSIAPIRNKVIPFSTGVSRTFFTAKGGLFVFAAFQPATGQARMGVAGNSRELALEILHDTHRRKGRSPEKPQIFLSLLMVAYPESMEGVTCSRCQ